MFWFFLQWQQEVFSISLVIIKGTFSPGRLYFLLLYYLKCFFFAHSNSKKKHL